MSELFKEVNGCCPYCNGRINLIEGMVLDYNLDKDGYPDWLNSEHYKVAAYCVNCSTQLYAIPNDHGGYSICPVNPMYTIEELKRIGLDTPRISVTSNKILESTDEGLNPFTNVRASLNTIEEDNNSNLIVMDIPF